MGFISNLIGIPLGWVIWVFYNFLGHHYVLSLFLFTLFTRLLLLPSTIKQQKSAVKNARLKPKTDALQKKYANNKQKYQEELMKLYEKEGYNPMSGCLPLLIQLPILYGLINVVYNPLTHIVRLGSETIAKISEIVKEVAPNFANQAEIYAINHATDEAFASLGADVIEKMQSINLNFLGINLGEKPTWAFNILLLIPILSGLTSLLVSLISQKNMTAQQGDAANNPTMKGMMLFMPLLSLLFTFGVPAGVGLYWIFSNIISAVQTVILYKVYNPQQIAAQMEAEEEAKKEEERQARIEAKKALKQARENGEEVEADEKALSQKEINKRKIAEARKRMAEKYGEEYTEKEEDQ